MPVARVPLTASDVKRQAAALGFDLCGIAPAGALPELRFFREWLDAGHAGEMDYLHRSAERRRDVRQVLPSARTVVVLRHGLQHRSPVLDRVRGQQAGGDRAVCLGRRLSPRDPVAPRSDGRVAARGSGRRARSESLRRHRPGPGARLRAARRARMDRQEHLRDQPRPGLLDFPLRDHHQPGARAGRARAGPVRDLHVVPRGVPDRRADGALHARFTTVPVVPHDRDQGRDPARAPRRDRVACLRLRHLSGSLSLQCGASRLARSGVGPTRRPRSPGPPRPLAPVGRRPAAGAEGQRDEAGRRAAAEAQPGGRAREQRRSGRRRGVDRAARADLRGSAGRAARARGQWRRSVAEPPKPGRPREGHGGAAQGHGARGRPANRWPTSCRRGCRWRRCARPRRAARRAISTPARRRRCSARVRGGRT